MSSFKLRPQSDALFCLLPDDDIHTVVEIGVAKGAWIDSCLLHIPNDAIVYAIDPWESKFRRKNYVFFIEHFENELSSGKIVAIRQNSLEAVATWNRPIDVLHLDGDHTALLADLRAWVPKVRKGGFICGHDILGHRQSRYVHRDLSKYFGKLKPFFIGPVRGTTVECALKIHTFWFYKDTPYGEHHSLKRAEKKEVNNGSAETRR